MLVSSHTAIAAIFALGLAMITIWSRRRVWIRVAALVMTCGLILSFWHAFAVLQGKPRVMNVEDFRKEKVCAVIPYGKIKNNVGVYMIVLSKDSPRPEYIFVEWNRKFAMAFQDARRMAKQKPVVFGGEKCPQSKQKPAASDEEKEADEIDREFLFYPEPIEEDPPKSISPFYESPH